ncbi:Translation initiation factor RLI1 [Penicillium atrosanguineum]|uniref:FAD-binding domain-containing protein n=1 Tax=Penicillium atrosanguineum TaxID=1132637 RepID=A0A9W9PR39_9EURO|nr:Translation initiation factor RLI1 [Penicillium atrosanguineum]KAJ5137806.1 hypothetical protein N7526_004039 [Penicillium atrosanguineum]KAJ5289652.1 Translation initiation factor RLI1 [Penicillium atrosanguineum]KAJ5307471.1 hypothetical protein N7476_008127 [Penicillium atrosanguineum]
MYDLQKVIIIGGGPTGLAAAIRLAQHNKLNPVIYELRNPETAGIGGSLGIPANGVRILHRLDLWNIILPRSVDITKTVLHSTSGSVLSEVDIASEAKQRTGFGYLRINRVDLVECLREGTQKYQIPIHYDKKVTSIDDRGDSVTVTFSDGTSDTASLLLGCDGIHSAVRKMHVDPGVAPVYSGISAISSIVDDVINRDPNDTDCLHSTITPHGMLATAPCAGKQIFWFFSKEVPLPKGTSSADVRDGWLLHRQKELADCRSSLSNVLDCVHGQWGEYLRQLVDASRDVHFYPHYRLPLGGRWFLPSDAPQGSPRVLLMGDAAHAVQPHAGQGVALALEDVLLLSGLLAQYQAGDCTTLGEVFGRFDRLRRPRIQRINEVALRNGRMRRNQSPWSVWCKEWYMWIMLHVNRFWGMSMSGVLNGDVLYDVEAELKQPDRDG